MSNNTHDRWDGTKYNRNSALQYDAAINYLHQHHFHGNESILDIGCGDGKITHEIAKLVPQGQVLGVDASQNMLDVAIMNFQTDQLTFALKNAEQLDFDAQFDLITSFFCLQWVPNKLSAFQGIAKALKPKGEFLAVLPTINRLIENTNDLMQDQKWQKYFVDFGDPIITARDTHYDKYAREAGLLLEEYTRELIKPTFASKQEMGDWLYAVTPHLMRLPSEEEKQAYIEKAVDLYLEYVPANQDGSCHAEFYLIKMKARI